MYFIDFWTAFELNWADILFVWTATVFLNFGVATPSEIQIESYEQLIRLRLIIHFKIKLLKHHTILNVITTTKMSQLVELYYIFILNIAVFKPPFSLFFFGNLVTFIWHMFD